MNLAIEFKFFDANGTEINKVNKGIAEGKATFEKGTINFDANAIANAKSYSLKFEFQDLSNSPNSGSFIVIDNMKFSDAPGNNVSVAETTKPTVNVYPNPTTGILNYSLTENETVKQVVVTSIDGKQTVFEPNFTNSIDISALATGIYSIAILNENDKVIGTQKVVLTK